MDEFSEQLLEIGYQDYQSNRTSMFKPRNSDELFCFSNAADSLAENGLINPISENIGSDSIDIFHTTLEYEITDEGVRYLRARQRENKK